MPVLHHLEEEVIVERRMMRKRVKHLRSHLVAGVSFHGSFFCESELSVDWLTSADVHQLSIFVGGLAYFALGYWRNYVCIKWHSHLQLSTDGSITLTE